MRLSLILLVFEFLIFNADASQNICASAEDGAAVEITKLQTLRELKEFHFKYVKCKDAGLGEAYAEAVSKLLDENWNSINNSSDMNDPKTIASLIAGVGETWEMSRFQRILKKAKKNCSKAAKKVCSRIIQLEKFSSGLKDLPLESTQPK